MSISESPTLNSELINVWGVQLGRAVATEIPVAQVVGENDHHVGAFRPKAEGKRLKAKN